jgi:MYXO-CTERM domain-containing protein
VGSAPDATATEPCDSDCAFLHGLVAPPPGATAPLNARILASDGFNILENEAGEVVATEESPANDFSLIWLQPTEDLQPSTTYRLRHGADGSTSETFVTGTERDTAAPADVVVDFDESSLFCGSIASLNFEASASNEDYLVVEVSSTTASTKALGAGPNGFMHHDCLPNSDEDTDATVRVYDLAGNAAEPIEQPLDLASGGCSCSSTGGANASETILLLLLAVVGWWRRG